MFDEVDEALRQLLEDELNISNGEIDILFNQPKREWTARLNRPTINLFLYDIRENNKRRTQSPAWLNSGGGGGSVTQTRQPFWVDLHYMLTAWTREPEDEHRLLSNVMMALLRYPYMPENLITGELANLDDEIIIRIAQYDGLQNMDRLWAAMDNEMRIAIDCTVTLPLNPFDTITTPVVKSVDTQFGQSYQPSSGLYDEGGASNQAWIVSGTLNTSHNLQDIRLILVERGQYIPLDPSGRFFITNLREGEYHLEILIEGEDTITHPLLVPSDEYDIDL
jgi:hypothetical protein